MNKIKISICGYGNLGKAVESEIKKNNDMELEAIFTRRDPKSIKNASNAAVENISNINKWANKIDVMIMCGGSSTDLPVQVPDMCKLFNTVDSFDTHAKIPEYFDKINKIAKETKHTSTISVGWDPGMFSVMRLYANSILHDSSTYTFWGKGVSQGHSDAIRRIDGVKDAKQYTIPVESAIEKIRNGESPKLSVREKHTRECYVVAEEGTDKKKIEAEIKNMPNYFSDYNTIVHFISEEELKKEHSGMAHGGFVLSSGTTGNGNKHIIEYSLKLQSNPEFTGSVLLAIARATYRMHNEGMYGAKTIFDIPPIYMSNLEPEQIRKELL